MASLIRFYIINVLRAKHIISVFQYKYACFHYSGLQIHIFIPQGRIADFNNNNDERAPRQLQVSKEEKKLEDI